MALILIRSIVGDSMSPTILSGVLVVAIRRRPTVGSVVIVRHGGLEKIKRLVRLEACAAYVEGDNRLESTDSRHFGPIDPATIIGTVIWPRRLRRSRPQ